MFPKSLEKHIEGGRGIKNDKHPRLRNRPPPRIFTHGNFFENNLLGNRNSYGKST